MGDLNKGEGPTKTEVLDSISSLTHNHPHEISVGPKDVFILYYSGHGSSDGQRFKFHTRDGALSQSEMVDVVAQLGARDVVFIIDACHAGAFSAHDIEHKEFTADGIA